MRWRTVMLGLLMLIACRPEPEPTPGLLGRIARGEATVQDCQSEDAHDAPRDVRLAVSYCALDDMLKAASYASHYIQAVR